MPLIVITGLPSSGKTHRAQQILVDFQSRISTTPSIPSPHISKGLTIQHLPSYHASLDPPHIPSQYVLPTEPATEPPTNPRDIIYNSAREEKTARAEEFSAVKRALSKNNVVIADAPNYIKGFRYQMWCEAKAVGTRSVVVHVAAREDECIAWNKVRIKTWGWEELLRADEENAEVGKGAKVGRGVQGDLQPESHTAIYGDRLVDEVARGSTRSRSSSMGGTSSKDGDIERRVDLAETMTLKSLYISDQKPDTETNGNGITNGYASHSGISKSEDNNCERSTTAAPSNPPPPTASLPYTPATLKSLSMRYEPPSPFTRWDTPLFTVPSTDDHPPYQAIWDALFPPPVKPTKKTISQIRSGELTEAKAEEVRRHAATVLPKATGAEALQTLESATADVVKILLASARDSGAADGEGGSLAFSVPDPKNGSNVPVEIEVPLNVMLGQPALQRLRRKYTQMQRGGIAHGQGYISGRAEVIKDFSKFIETEWNAD